MKSERIILNNNCYIFSGVYYYFSGYLVAELGEILGDLCLEIDLAVELLP